MEERRQSDRRKTYLGGTIIFNSNGSTIDCLVRNLSSAGAMIEIDSFSHPPGEFHFEVGKRGHRAMIAWRNATRAGITFAASASEPISIEWSRRLKKCEAEKLRLLHQLQDLRSA